MLIRSAHSPNITERHDCSTALFDPQGELVMQAEHIPVHLGSMPDAVAAILDEEHSEGDLWILNDPYRGGTHLPDITLSLLSFEADELLGFAASRAHHADIGGPTPGGMPALSETLEEEGVVIPPTRADDATLEGLAGQMRNPRAAPGGPPRPAGVDPDRDQATARDRRAPRHRGAGRSDARDPRLRGAAHPRGALGDARRGEQRRGLRGGPRRRDPAARPCHGERRGAGARLRGHRGAGQGQPQLPALGHQGRQLLRRSRRLRSRCPSLGGRVAAGHGQRARGIAAERRLPGGRGGRERRDLEPRGGPRLRRPRRTSRPWAPTARER